MKTMLVSDFAAMRTSLIQLAGIYLFIIVVLAWGMENVTAAAAAGVAMAPVMMALSLAVADESHDWQRFRLTLPITRRQVVLGRYATVFSIGLLFGAGSIVVALVGLAVLSSLPAGTVGEGLTFAGNSAPVLVGGCTVAFVAALLACAGSLPLTFRFGVNKATRFVPAVLTVLIVVVFVLIGNDFGAGTPPRFLADVAAWAEQGLNYLWLALIAAAAGIGVFWGSSLLAAKLYERRSF